jgi:AcrR family transcriptional regulator
MESKSRLHRSDFLRMGLDILVDEGPGSLTAARVSKQLHVTTGSFYWHFRTVAEFHAETQEFWLRGILIPLIREARELAEHPGSVLEVIGQIVRQRGIVHYDGAMRRWARSDQDARKIVDAADKVRQELIKEVFLANGEGKAQATDKTDLFGAAWLGSQAIDDSDHRFRLLGMITGETES